MKDAIALRPSYWASVSGGKDSLFMLNYILHNLDRYLLDGVVHFELEIDFPFIHDVIDYMEAECKRFGIRFERIKPRKTWEEIFYSSSDTTSMRGFPTRAARWCNREYKLDAKRQLEEFMNSLGFYVVSYIGYCVDEVSRYRKRRNASALVTEIYPLVENGFSEPEILDWAKTQPIFNRYYLTNRRCGCMYCPLSSMITWAYLCKYYPENWKYAIDKMRETEAFRAEELGRPFSVISGRTQYNADYLARIIPSKWVPRLEALETETAVIAV